MLNTKTFLIGPLRKLRSFFNSKKKKEEQINISPLLFSVLLCSLIDNDIVISKTKLETVKDIGGGIYLYLSGDTVTVTTKKKEGVEL